MEVFRFIYFTRGGFSPSLNTTAQSMTHMTHFARKLPFVVCELQASNLSVCHTQSVLCIGLSSSSSSSSSFLFVFVLFVFLLSFLFFSQFFFSLSFFSFFLSFSVRLFYCILLV